MRTLLQALAATASVASVAAVRAPPACDQAQVTAAQQLIDRVLGGGGGSASFALSCSNLEERREGGSLPSFEIRASPAGGPISISGSSGVALASGFHWYLKHSCNISLLYGHQSIAKAAIPSNWPAVPTTVSMESPVQWQYYMNVCTHSYSAAWWDWERWQTEIDWMAMMGINLPLAFTGQEFVWDKVYRETFGLTRADMDAHFAGPAFLAWGRMGNIRGWGGVYESAGVTGLTPHWMEAQRQMQKLIVARERSLGMRTVLPAFAGHVPLALPAKFPGTKMGNNPCWGASGFTGQRWSCDGLLDAADPKFTQIAEAFMLAQKAEYGSDGIYNGDTFNEMAASGNITEWGSGVYSAMAKADADATWFIQGWSLNGWPTERLNAYFAGIPAGGLLSLELSCVTSSSSFLKFTSQLSPPRPVICGLLDNMGGRRSLSGSLGTIASQPLANVAKAGNTPDGQALLAGIGWNPEDLHSNPVKWQLLGEVGWRSRDHAITDIGQWLDGYVGRRYAPAGGTPTLLAAWRTLLDAAYGGDTVHTPDSEDEPDYSSMAGGDRTSSSTRAVGGMSTGLAAARDAPMFSKDGFCRVPSFGFKLWRTHNTSGVVEAWRLLLVAANETATRLHSYSTSSSMEKPGVSSTIAAFSYDLVDVTRQALQDQFAAIYTNLSASCIAGSAPTPAPTPSPRPKPGQPVSWVPHSMSNCNGACVAMTSTGPNGGHCDRMPGCGHDAQLPFCDPKAMEARCLNVSTCTCFNTNGYLYAGGSVTPFHGYNLTAFTITGAGPPPPAPAPPPPPLSLFKTPECIQALSEEGEGGLILELGADLERLLATDEHFLLGNWVAAARQWGNTTQESNWLEWNARMQVTLWGSLEANNAAISDYASKQVSYPATHARKAMRCQDDYAFRLTRMVLTHSDFRCASHQWSGLVGSYHLPLWKLWLTKMKAAAVAGATTAPDVSLVLVQQAEKWVNSTSPTFPTTASGEDPVHVSQELYDKWVLGRR